MAADNIHQYEVYTIASISQRFFMNLWFDPFFKNID